MSRKLYFGKPTALANKNIRYYLFSPMIRYRGDLQNDLFSNALSYLTISDFSKMKYT